MCGRKRAVELNLRKDFKVCKDLQNALQGPAGLGLRDFHFHVHIHIHFHFHLLLRYILLIIFRRHEIVGTSKTTSTSSSPLWARHSSPDIPLHLLARTCERAHHQHMGWTGTPVIRSECHMVLYLRANIELGTVLLLEIRSLVKPEAPKDPNCQVANMKPSRQLLITL